MKISRRKIIELVREAAGEMRSQEAIANAKSMREDGLSFEDFITTLLDYLENQTNQQWSEEMLPEDWNFYDEWIEGADPYSIGAEYLADAAVYMMENKMKVTKRQLKRIIKEAVTDNVMLNVVDGDGSKVKVHIPYYIITDALEDGISVDGLFIEIEEYIEANYYLNAWDFTEQSEKEIEKMSDKTLG